MNNEIWKSVKGYEGLYEVSNKGNVRGMPRKGTRGGILSQRKRNGYLAVDLTKGNKKETCDVHRLVALAFIKNADNLPIVNHRDEDKTNNSADNLEWCTEKYNVNYGDGIAKMIRTRESKSRSFVCKETGKTYKSQTRCANDIGVSQGQISRVLHRYKESAKGFHFEFI